ncbi:hypothetical protein B0O80DRAFT_437241 [Mortierella sp. GBAus27b]|nr:hypothetical protein B0O80DRAFT_437241 [Mortierella sp. GBAus27b]
MARPAGSSEVISASSLAFEEHAPAQDHEVQEANEAHDKVYNQSTYVTDEEAGKAAGAQAFKKAEAKAEETGGSVDKSDLATNAMAEVMKLIQGGKGGDDKSAMLKNAVTTAMKLFAAKKMAGGNVSEGGSNPLESLMGNPAVAGALSNPAVAGLLGKFMGGGKD